MEDVVEPVTGTFSTRAGMFWKLQAMGNGAGDVERDTVLESPACLNPFLVCSRILPGGNCSCSVYPEMTLRVQS